LFADEVKRERARLKMSQQALSDTTDIPKRTIEDWEGGRRTPPAWVQRLVLEKLAQMKRSE
jgi:DNA-binding transcriptional regulator YiaG